MIGVKIVGLLCLQLAIGGAWCRSINETEGQASAGDGANSKRAFSIEDVISNAYTSDTFNGTWISESEIFYRVEELLLVFHSDVQKSEVIAKERVFAELNSPKFTLSADKNYVLIANKTNSVYRHSNLCSYTIYNLKTKSLSKLADGQDISTALWAPVGCALAFVLKNDVYYHQLSGEESETRRLTFTGSKDIFNGIPDWVYEEEVLAADKALWFSPNGEYLVFASFNDSHVRESVILRYGDPGSLEYQYPKEERFRYPKPGTKNPQVSLSIVDLTDHGSWLIDLKAPTDMVGSQPILFAVCWFDKKTVVASWTNREQNYLIMATYTVSGLWQPLYGQEEFTGWLLFNYVSEPPVYHNGYVLLIKPQPVEKKSLGSFGHVTRYRYLNGVLDHEKDLTPGLTWVYKIYGVNDVKRVVFYTATPPGEPGQKHLYEVSLETSMDSTPSPKCLSCDLKSLEGNPCKYVNSVSFSTDLSRYALTCSGTDPATIKIYDLQGTDLYTWSENRPLRQMIAKRIIPSRRYLDVESNGFDAKVKLMLPRDFNPAKKYPLLVNVYGGPDSQSINDGFSVGFDTYMSTNRHVIYAWIDGRGSSSKGTAMIYAVYRNLGSAEMEDQITVTRKLQQTYPWIDRNRTAIWGWSYGGYSTAMILTKDEDNVFQCGISVAPVTNWIYYDSVYTERYMGLPKASDNLKGYQASDLTSRAKKLKGKRFMLVHGTGDDNVHYQQSMALSKSLAEAGVLYDQVSYPDEAHHLTHVTSHFYHTMDKFWSQCFGYDLEA